MAKGSAVPSYWGQSYGRAASVGENLCVRCVQVAVEALFFAEWVNLREAEGYDRSMVGHAGQSFRLACPCGQETEGLKTPGY